MSAQPLTERELLIDFLVSLRLDRARNFLRSHGLPFYGTRADLRERLSEELDGGRGLVTSDDLVLYLDEVEPWGKQHVFVYNPPERTLAGWATPEEAARSLAGTSLGALVDRPLPLALPAELTVSSVRVSERGFSILAVERRRHDEHVEALDRVEQTPTGRTVEYRAYMQVISRGIVLFRWDMVSGVATLHITQATSQYSYDDAEAAFAALVSDAIPWATLTRRDLRPAIRSLYNQEAAGAAEVRSHQYRVRSALGRDIDVTSPTADDSVLGEPEVDAALRAVVPRSAGRIGNFYWLAGAGPAPAANPIPRQQHVVILGEDGRVHFMTASEEAVVTYVLQRIRALS